MGNEINLATMLQDLANLQPSEEAIRRFQKRWPNFLPEAPTILHSINFKDYRHLPPGLLYVICLRDIVRRLWVGDSEAGPQLEPLLLTGEFNFYPRSLPPKLAPAPSPGIVGIDSKRGGLVYRPQMPIQEALYYLIQNVRRAKICGNPDCPSPYFISGRSRYCSTDCSAAIQRHAKTEWWKIRGQEWRKLRQLKLRRGPVARKRGSK